MNALLISFRGSLALVHCISRPDKSLSPCLFIENGLTVTRKTAVNYLSALEKEGFLTSEKVGKERIYQNKRLYDLVKYG